MAPLVLAIEFGLRVVGVARHLLRPANDLTGVLEVGWHHAVRVERFVKCGDKIVESLIRLNPTGNKQGWRSTITGLLMRWIPRVR